MKKLSTANLLSIHVLILRIFVFGGATRIVGAGSRQSQIGLCKGVLLANPLPGASGLGKLTKGTLKLIKLVREKLQQNEDEESVQGSGGETEMMAILEMQIKEMEEELECPVCLEVCQPGPIFKCSEDHLVCRDCKPKMTECPICREEFTLATSKRFRGAERQAERLVALKKQLQCRPVE